MRLLSLLLVIAWGAVPVTAHAVCRVVEGGFGPKGTAAVQAQKAITGLEVPWGLAFLPNGDWLVTERAGRVRRVMGGKTLLPEPVVTIDVDSSAESGLLGIALHPKFSGNRYFYVYYTAMKSGRSVNRVERYRLADDGASAKADRVIIDDIPSSPRHDGGRLRFGPDGNLYVGTGDATQPKLSQDPKSLAGKILRLTPDGAIPADNPRAGLAMYLLGIRNTQGFDWIDAGTMIVTDHGPSGELGRTGGDEVSIARAGDNLGWPDIWKCGTRAGMVTPEISWSEALPPGGAALYSGAAIPEWRGSLLIGSLGAEQLNRVALNGATAGANEVYLEGQFGRLRDVIQAPDGTLYATTSNCDGRGDCGEDKDAILRFLHR